MGGTVEKVAGGVASGVVAVGTGGLVSYDPNTGGIKASANPTDVFSNYSSGVSGGKVVQSITPQMPELPKAADPLDQAKRAEAEAKAKLNKELGQKASGLSSTVLGGSIGDNSVLKKRKLLGE